jgi:DNA polymerase-1
MDGSAFIFRSFYAYREMSRSDGFPTNALYMVARLIMKLLREEKPTSFAFIMDGKGPTFRHERFPEYKAQRQATPEPLVRQIAPLRQLLDLVGVPVLVSQGNEADDCISSLAYRFRDRQPVIILGADKDLKQCLDKNVVIWDPAAKDEKITTLEDFRAQTGMEPSSWPDYQALVGDSSDNIPGVPKVGPKTADELIRNWPTLEDLFDHLNGVPPKTRAKLEGQRDNAMLYRELTRLQCDACPNVTEDDLRLKPVRLRELLALLQEYELRSLAREVESMSRAGMLPGLKNSPDAAGGSHSPYAAPKSSPPADAAPKAGGMLAGNASGPQPVTPIRPAEDKDTPRPSTCPKTGAQGSLLGSVAPVADFPTLPSIDNLPDILPCALLRLPQLEGGELFAAAGSVEGLCGFSPDALAPRLSGAAGDDFVLVTDDAKALCKAFPGLWSIPSRRIFDLSLAAYLLSPEERGYGWAQVSVRAGEQCGSQYSPATQPGLLALDIFRYQQEQLDGADLTTIFRALELPLVPVLARMEERGITIDMAAFENFRDEAQTELDRLTTHIHELAGRSFNIRSSQQLSDVLFTVLNLPKSGKTRGGALSTSQEALEKLSGKHPIIEAILEYRKLEKLRSTYLEPLPRLADSEGRIHTTFNQTATATGRLSSSNPNLQNIPARGQFGTRMRACFTAPSGKLLVGADYSQIELRVLAHLSGDPTLLSAFRNNEDIHSRTAGLLYDVSLDKVTPDMRRNAKTINFGLIYGMGAQKLAQELHTGMKEAKAFIERYFERLSRLKEFYDAVEHEAAEQGFVSTMAGRRRFTPDILSNNNQLRSQARRQAINTRIQGSAADIIKIAMIAVENDPALHALEARLLLQIHDELLLEAPEANADAAGKRLAEIMGAVEPGGQKLSVPLLVDWGVGRTWADTH